MLNVGFHSFLVISYHFCENFLMENYHYVFINSLEKRGRLSSDNASLTSLELYFFLLKCPINTYQTMMRY